MGWQLWIIDIFSFTLIIFWFFDIIYTYKGVNWCLKYVRQVQQQRHESPTVILYLCKDVPLVEFMYLVFTSMPGESYHRQFRSSLLHLCYVFRALINSLVCWLCTSALGFILFQIYNTHNFYVCLYVTVINSLSSHYYVPTKHLAGKKKSV